MDQALVEPPRLSWASIHRLLAYGPHFRTMTQDQVSAACDFHHLDYRAFGDELQAIKRELDASRSEADFRHLRKIERWGRLCSVAGYATAWIVPNPISAFLISQGNFTRWTMVTHHVTHRGYDKTPGVPRRYTSKHFARGWRRFVDWLDWIVPDAWDLRTQCLSPLLHGRSHRSGPGRAERRFLPRLATSHPDQSGRDRVFHVHLEAALLCAEHDLDSATRAGPQSESEGRSRQVALGRSR